MAEVQSTVSAFATRILLSSLLPIQFFLLAIPILLCRIIAVFFFNSIFILSFVIENELSHNSSFIDKVLKF